MDLSFDNRMHSGETLPSASFYDDALSSSIFLTELPLDAATAALALDSAPLPPPELREYYNRGKHFDYWLSGLRDCRRALAHWTQPNSPTAIFEFGASSGRVLRHFSYQFPEATCYGSDLNINTIEWMLRNLRQNIYAFQNTVVPTLPLPDNYFDIVVANSVFTHIDNYEYAWLLELARISKPGALLYITIMNDAGWDATMKADWRYDSALKYTVGFEAYPRGCPMPKEVDRLAFRGHGRPYGNTFHRNSYICTVWGRLFDVLAIDPPPNNSMLGIQAGVAMRPKK
jgi:SAM-dependent methyltransferase